MKNNQNNDNFTEDDEFILRINLDTKETRVYRGSQIVKQVVDEDVDPVEFTIKVSNTQ